MSTSRIDLILRQLDALPPLPAELVCALGQAESSREVEAELFQPLVDALVLTGAPPARPKPGSRLPDLQTQLWTHAIAVGCAAELLADRLARRRGKGRVRLSPASAFACGLLHDLGKLALNAALPKSYARVVTAADERRLNIADAERSVIGIDHHTAGRRLAERWRLPAAVRQVILLHNQQPEALPETEHAAMIRLVSLADALVRGRRIGYSGNYRSDMPPEVWSSGLSLRQQDLELALDKTVELASARSAALGLTGGDSRQLYRNALERSSRELSRAQARLSEHEQLSQARSRGFAALAGLSSSLTPGDTLADALGVITQSAAGVLDCGPVAGFIFASDSAAEMVLVEAGRLSQRGHADATAESASMRPVRPAVTARGENAIAPAGDELEWVTSLYGPRLRGQRRWWLRLESDGRTIGGIVWGGGDEEPARLEPQVPELSGLRAGWSLALRGVQARHEASQLAEELVRSNQRFAEAQDQLARERAASSLAELAAGAAHEMNNPLMIISGRSQLLCQRLTDPRDVQASRVIHQNAQRLSDMITALMRFARPEPANRQPTAIESLFNQTQRLIAAAPERKDRQIEWSLPELPPAHADGPQVARALAALLENALQATEAGAGRIEVHATLDAAAERILITILDNGPGMDAATLRRAFDPFFSKKPAGRRRGMGLPVALRLVETNGGTLRLESSPGAGTRATVSLPIAAAPGSTAPAIPAAA